jgi:SAM-dependent methyltransferase
MMDAKPLHCRFCGEPLSCTFVDLGLSPLANSYRSPGQLGQGEMHFPLHVFLCDHCFLVQLPDTCSSEEIFSDYAYFSSYSDSWLQHARDYCREIIARNGIGKEHLVVEIASNDGYLLKNFVEAGIPVLGVEPAENVARAAAAKGIPTVVKFFGRQTALELAAGGSRADLLIGNNVLAHVPDLNDFVAGLKILLKPNGTLTMEFPHLLRLIEENQFDTIYHEHFSYFSFSTVQRVFAHHGLRLFDVEELPTHGGSLRIFACHAEDPRAVSDRVARLRRGEEEKGLGRLEVYRAFQQKVLQTKIDILSFLIQARREGKKICAYGAPAKGNTLLNYCGIRTDFIEYTVDRNPHKQNHYLPGSLIPIFPPEKIFDTQPDYLVILPWNLKAEIAAQMRGITAWGGRFVTFIPSIEVFA